MSYVAIFGRMPVLSLAELEALYGSDAVRPIDKTAAIISVDQNIIQPDFHGGTLKLCRVIDTLPYSDWNKMSNYLTRELPGDWTSSGGTKLTLGLSVYGFNMSPRHVQATALTIKKKLRSDRNVTSVRVVPNQEAVLSTAQTYHNKLTSDRGLELALIKNGHETIVTQVSWVQDIDGYAARDQARPYRDARVGMLPPKLAQTIVNLAAPHMRRRPGLTVLDPFCGTGVLLQEALLMGYNVIGSDIDERMVDYSQKNLQWLNENRSFSGSLLSVVQADATSVKFSLTNDDIIACETYLGRPLSSLPDSQTLKQIMSDTNTIHRKFLQNVARQTKKGFRMCIAVPVWKIQNSYKHLSTLENLQDLGYNRIQFVHVDTSKLIYHRDGQFVGRELIVLERI